MGDDAGGHLGGHIPIHRGKDLFEGSTHQRVALARHVPQHVAYEVHTASLPLGSDHRLDRLLESGVGVGDHQLHTGKPARDQPPDELAPPRLGFDLADIDADDLPAAGLVDPVGDKKCLVAHRVDL